MSADIYTCSICGYQFYDAAYGDVEAHALKHIDPARLADAMDACLPVEFGLHTPGNVVRAKAVAREYEARFDPQPEPVR